MNCDVTVINLGTFGNCVCIVNCIQSEYYFTHILGYIPKFFVLEFLRRVCEMLGKQTLLFDGDSGSSSSPHSKSRFNWYKNAYHLSSAPFLVPILVDECKYVFLRFLSIEFAFCSFPVISFTSYDFQQLNIQ